MESHRVLERRVYLRVVTFCFLLAIQTENRIDAAPFESIPLRSWVEDLKTSGLGATTDTPLKTQGSSTPNETLVQRALDDITLSSHTILQHPSHSELSDERNLREDGSHPSDFLPAAKSRSSFQSRNVGNTGTRTQNVEGDTSNERVQISVSRISKVTQINDGSDLLELDSLLPVQNNGDSSKDRSFFKSSRSSIDKIEQADVQLENKKHLGQYPSNFRTTSSLKHLDASISLDDSVEDNLARLATGNNNLVTGNSKSAHGDTTELVTSAGLDNNNDRNHESHPPLSKPTSVSSNQNFAVFPESTANLPASADGNSEMKEMATNNVIPKNRVNFYDSVHSPSSNSQHSVKSSSEVKDIGQSFHDQQGGSMRQFVENKKTAAQDTNDVSQKAVTSNSLISQDSTWSDPTEGKINNKVTIKSPDFDENQPTQTGFPEILRQTKHTDKLYHQDRDKDPRQNLYRRIFQFLAGNHNKAEQLLASQRKFSMMSNLWNDQPPQMKRDSFDTPRQNDTDSGRFVLSVDKDFLSYLADFHDAPHTSIQNYGWNPSQTKFDREMFFEFLEYLMQNGHSLFDQNRKGQNLLSDKSSANKRQKPNRKYNLATDHTPRPIRHSFGSGISATKRRGFRACNSRRLSFKTLLEFFLTGKMCGSNVVRMRFGIGRR